MTFPRVIQPPKQSFFLLEPRLVTNDGIEVMPLADLVDLLAEGGVWRG